jgi:hypothetical protein
MKEHQSGFPHIRQGLRRLTRQKMFEDNDGMASMPTALFSDWGNSPIGEVVPRSVTTLCEIVFADEHVHFHLSAPSGLKILRGFSCRQPVS